MDTTTSAYRDRLTVQVATGVDCEAAEVDQAHELKGDDLESGKGADFSDLENYFIVSEIFESF